MYPMYGVNFPCRYCGVERTVRRSDAGHPNPARRAVTPQRSAA